MSAAQTEFDQLTSDKSRRTTHHDARSFLNISDGEDDDEDAHRRNRGRDNNNNNDNDNDADPRVSRDNPSDYFPPTTLTRPRHSIPPTRYAANTGPKGVISDAQNFRESCRQYRRSQHQRPTAAPGARRPPPSHFATTTYTSSADRDPLSTSDAPANHGTRDDDNDEDDDDRNGNGDDADAIPSEDEDFMHHWRRRRLHEMQSSRAGGGGGGGGGGKTQMRERPRRLWGGLATVDGKGYLDAVDGSGPDTVVIVYIYDDYVSRAPPPLPSLSGQPLRTQR